MEIRALEVDFDKDILKINGKEVVGRPVMVTLPGVGEKFPYRKLFNPDMSTGQKEECDRLEITVINVANSENIEVKKNKDKEKV